MLAVFSQIEFSKIQHQAFALVNVDADKMIIVVADLKSFINQ